MSTGEELWQRFLTEWRQVDPNGSGVVVLGRSFFILADALKCYDADSPSGAALLCRATIESAGYLFLTRRKDPGSTAYLFDPPRTLSGEIRDVSLEEIKGGLAKAGILTADQLAALSRIQKDGNFAAHLVSTRDREEAKVLQKLLQEGALGKGPSRVSARELVKREEAKQDLEDTIEILLAIWREVKRQASVPPSGPSIIGTGGRA